MKEEEDFDYLVPFHRRGTAHCGRGAVRVRWGRLRLDVGRYPEKPRQLRNEDLLQGDRVRPGCHR